MTRPQLIAALVLALAVVSCAYGLLLYASASIPYQDPTPQLLLEQARQLRSAQAVSVVAALVAVACLMRLRHLRKQCR